MRRWYGPRPLTICSRRSVIRLARHAGKTTLFATFPPRCAVFAFTPCPGFGTLLDGTSFSPVCAPVRIGSFGGCLCPGHQNAAAHGPPQAVDKVCLSTPPTTGPDGFAQPELPIPALRLIVAAHSEQKTMLCQIVFFFGSLLILLSQGWSSFPFRCGSTVIGPDSGAAWESQQALWGGLPGVGPDQEGLCESPPRHRMPSYWGLGFTPNRTSRLDWPAFRRWDRQSFALRPRWWMKQDSNLRARSLRHGAESAQLLHPSKLTPHYCQHVKVLVGLFNQLVTLRRGTVGWPA